MIFNTSASATHATEDRDNRSQSLPPIERAATVVTAAIDGGKLRARRADKLTVLAKTVPRSPTTSSSSPGALAKAFVRRLHRVKKQ
jgi:hypothetical protein